MRNFRSSGIRHALTAVFVVWANGAGSVAWASECASAGGEPLVAKAERLAAQGEPACAVASYEEALALEPDSAKIRAALGKALLALNRPVEAAAHLRVADRQAPGNPRTTLLLARALHLKGESEQALATLDRIPDDWAARIERTSILAGLGRHAEAAAELRALADSDPHDANLRLALAGALIQSHATAEGMAVLEAYLKENRGAQETFEVSYLSGLGARQAGDYPLATDRLRQAVARNPSHGDARYQLGFALARAGKLEEALIHLRQAESLEPESIEIRYQLTAVLRRLGRVEEAAREAEEVTRIKQERQRSTLTASAMNRAAAAMESGNAAEAIALYRQALDYDPANAKALYSLALALDAAGDAAGRRHMLEEAVAADPSFALAQHQLALQELAEGNVTQAETRLKLAVQSDPTIAEAFNNLGVLCGRTARPAEAVAWLRKAVTIRPSYVDAHRNLGLMLAQQGNIAEAERSLQRARELDPTDPRTQQALEMIRAGKR